MTPEGAIKRQIMDYLNAIPGCYARILQVGKVPGRKNTSAGMADIIGAFKGWALAIEVKAPKGRISDEQQAFLAGWSVRGGGISIIARCLDDVQRILNTVKERGGE